MKERLGLTIESLAEESGISVELIKKLRYDFMGYTFRKIEDLSFHHLIVPHKDCKKLGLGEGYLITNGAILNQETSHDYLHAIERVDREIFLRITQCMIEENRNGKIDIENLKKIRELLFFTKKMQVLVLLEIMV